MSAPAIQDEAAKCNNKKNDLIDFALFSDKI